MDFSSLDFNTICTALGTGAVTFVLTWSAVYAKTRDATVRSLRITIEALEEERNEWKARWDESREQIHKLRDDLHAAELKIQELTNETNFEPLKNKLEHFIERQSAVNASISDNLTILREIMHRMHAPLSPAMVWEQDKDLSDS